MFNLSRNNNPKRKISIIQKPKKEDPKSFFELSSSDQKKIIERAVVQANEDQKDLVNRARACN